MNIKASKTIEAGENSIRYDVEGDPIPQMIDSFLESAFSQIEEQIAKKEPSLCRTEKHIPSVQFANWKVVDSMGIATLYSESALVAAISAYGMQSAISITKI